MKSEPSNKAIEVAAAAYIQGVSVRKRFEQPKAGHRTRARIRGILRETHDPKLGLDRSVCLRDVVETLRAEQARFKTPNAEKVIDYIEREFGGGS